MSRFMIWSVWSLLTLVGPAGARADEPNAAHRAKVRQEIHEWAVQQIFAELHLDAAAQAQFRGVDARYQPQLDAAHGEVRQAMHALKQGEAGGNGAVVGKLTDEVLAARQKAQAIEAQRRAELRRVLSPQQFGQLLVIWPKIHRSIQAKIWKSMHAGANPGAMGPTESGE